MKILHFKKNSQEWLDSRSSLITGTKNKDLIVKRGTGKKKGFYQLIADRLLAPKPVNDFLPEGYDLKEEAHTRGHRLESEAVQKFRELMPTLTIKDDCVLCISEENPRLGYSPDALIYDNNNVIGTVEIKCLDGANHIEALITKDYSDFEWQIVQGFIVNLKQQYAYLVFYNPDLLRPLHYILITREELQEKITQMQEIHELTLTEVDEWVNKILNDLPLTKEDKKVFPIYQEENPHKEALEQMEKQLDKDIKKDMEVLQKLGIKLEDINNEI